MLTRQEWLSYGLIPELNDFKDANDNKLKDPEVLGRILSRLKNIKSSVYTSEVIKSEIIVRIEEAKLLAEIGHRLEKSRKEAEALEKLKSIAKERDDINREDTRALADIARTWDQQQAELERLAVEAKRKELLESIQKVIDELDAAFVVMCHKIEGHKNNIRRTATEQISKILPDDHNALKNRSKDEQQQYRAAIYGCINLTVALSDCSAQKEAAKENKQISSQQEKRKRGLEQELYKYIDIIKVFRVDLSEKGSIEELENSVLNNWKDSQDHKSMVGLHAGKSKNREEHGRQVQLQADVRSADPDAIISNKPPFYTPLRDGQNSRDMGEAIVNKAVVAQENTRNKQKDLKTSTNLFDNDDDEEEIKESEGPRFP
jgi:hypothetical protein